MKINPNVTLNVDDVKEKSTPNNKPEYKNTVWGDTNGNNEVDADEWVQLVGADKDTKKISFLLLCAETLASISKFEGDINDANAVKTFNDRIKKAVDAFNKAFNSSRTDSSEDATNREVTDGTQTEQVNNTSGTEEAQETGNETDENEQAISRTLNNEFVDGSYTINENGSYRFSGSVKNLYKNQAYNAFINGDIKEGEDGKYHFRSLNSNFRNALSNRINHYGAKITEMTEVYKDLKNKQANGVQLSAGEEKFMETYLNILNKNGLQINDLGLLEDIPSA